MSEAVLHASLRPRNVACILIAIAIVAATALAPTTEGLTYEGRMVLGILAAGILLWVTESLPLPATALLVLIMMPIMGVCSFDEAYSNAMGSTVFFLMGTFAFTVALDATTIPTRIAAFVLRRSGTDTNKMLLGFMCATTLVSTVMSDVPCTVLFLGFALTILKAADAKPLQSNLGRCLMIGIPIAAVTGGMATPAGSSFNVVAMNILQQATGTSISFLDWVLVALPVVIIMTPICWFFITAILKPEPIADSCLQGIRDQAAGAKKIEAYEVKAILVIGAMLVLWIVGNWVPVLNATVVALIGLTVMFLPGMDLLTWKEFQGSVPWGIVIMCGTIMSMGGVVEATGGAAFLAGAISGSGVMDLGFFAAFALLLALIYLLHTVCPIGVAILGIFLPIMITLCAGFGVSPAVPTIALAVVVAGNYLMPVNPTVMLTYGEGYYTFGDMFKTGIVPSVALVLIMAAWMPFIVGVMGL